MSKSNKFVLLTIGLLLIFSLVIGLSYAYWLLTLSQATPNVATTGCFEVNFTEESNAINLSNIYPVSDIQGASLTPYSFKIVNTCNYNADYQVNLETLSPTTLSLSNLKVKFGTQVPSLLSNFATTDKTINDANESRELTTGTLQAGETKTYDFRMWMDADTTLNEGQNKTYSGKIVVITSLSKEYTQYKDGIIATAPILYQGLIPVKYDLSGNIIVADSTTEWYNYGKKNWANAVLVNCNDETIKNTYFNTDMTLKTSTIGTIISTDNILNMYVWIPRYKYQLWNAENGTSNPQAINIKFENAIDTKSTGTTNSSWLTHPAFTFGNTELNGIWVGKFETSGTIEAPTIIPNSKSLVNISISQMYTSSRNISLTNYSNYGLANNVVDTHVIKNSEWGAVAYLSSSIYGRYADSDTCISSGCEIWINNVNTLGSGSYGSSITGCSGSSASASMVNSMSACASGYDWTTLGVNASTTGNQYGIYDLAGGAWEYVMSGMYNSTGTSLITSSSEFTSFPNNKYFSIYQYTETDTNNFNIYDLGSATKETLTNNTAPGSNGWNGDYVSPQYSTNPYLIRGGDYASSSYVGLYYFNRYGGSGSQDGSYRSVLSSIDN